MHAVDGATAADKSSIAVGDKSGPPQECCGGLNNVDYSKVKKKENGTRAATF